MTKINASKILWRPVPCDTYYTIFFPFSSCDDKMDFRERASIFSRLFHRLPLSIINALGAMPHVSEWIFGQSHITRFTYTRSIRSSRTTTAARQHTECVCVCVSVEQNMETSTWTGYNLHLHDDDVMRWNN